MKEVNTTVAFVRKPGYFVAAKSSTNDDVDMMDEFWPDDDNTLLSVSRVQSAEQYRKLYSSARSAWDKKRPESKQEGREKIIKRGRQFINEEKMVTKENVSDDDDDIDKTSIGDATSASTPCCLDMFPIDGHQVHPNTTSESFGSSDGDPNNNGSSAVLEDRTKLAHTQMSHLEDDDSLEEVLHRKETNETQRTIHPTDAVDIMRAVELSSVQWWKQVDMPQSDWFHNLKVNTNRGTSKVGSMNDLFALILRTGARGPCLDSSIWDYLSLRDLYQVRMVSKFAYEQLAWVEYNECCDGKGEYRTISA